MSEYNKGYNAGRRKTQNELAEFRHLTLLGEQKKERVYLSCLDSVLQHCNNWQIDGEKLNNAENYCKLARIFAENSIKVIDKL